MMSWKFSLRCSLCCFLLAVMSTSQTAVKSANAADAIVKLRSGAISLRPADDLTMAGDKSTTRTTSGKKLFFMQYVADVDEVGKSLSSDVSSQGGIVVANIPDNTLLVYMETKAAQALARSHGAYIGEYIQEAKLSPEVTKMIREQDANARRRRRLVENNIADGSSTNGAATDSRSSATPGLLQHLQKWSAPPANQKATVGATDNGKNKRRERSLASTTDLYGLKALLVANLSASELENVFHQWPVALGAELGYEDAEPCFPRALDYMLNDQFIPWLEVYVCSQDMERVGSWLADQSSVTWVAPALQLAPSNAVAGWITQTGDVSISRFNNLASELRPYWAAGIQGQGVIVGVADTGIDVSNCYFIDDRYKPSSMLKMLRRDCNDTCPLRGLYPNHRKIAQYMILDPENATYFGDEVGGHGTHVCGSVAGARPSGTNGFLNDEATGAAPMSRLSFMDLSAGFNRPLYLPMLPHHRLFPYHYSVGARHSSESWSRKGELATKYDELAQSVDVYLWLNPYFLVSIAVGNEGKQGEVSSIESPATAKNTLSVGASINLLKGLSYYDDPYTPMPVFRFRDKSNALQQRAVWPNTGTGLLPWSNFLYKKEIPVVLADPPGACSKLSVFTVPTIVIVELDEASCSYETVMSNVAESNAVGALYSSPNGDRTYAVVDRLPSSWNSQNNYYAIITKAQGQWLRNVMSNASNSDFHMTVLIFPDDVAFGIDSVAEFSAIGIWEDGRIKPDIVAPGYKVLSVRSSGAMSHTANSTTCSPGAMFMSGTSMAAPLASGHLALMRQYFRDGFYPRGSKTLYEATAFEPTGILLKATAIAGAKSLAGGIAKQSGAVLAAPPDGYQGWGRMDLSGALPLPGLTDPNMRIQVADFGRIYHRDVMYLTGLRATGTGPINAALVWYDYPTYPIIDASLINDLDFVYSINNGPFQRTREDHINTVERIELTNLQRGDIFTFAVLGNRVMVDTQYWAVAVAGHFTGTLETPLNPTYATPQRLQQVKRNMNVFGFSNTLGGSRTLCLRVKGAELVASYDCRSSVANLLSFTTKETDASTGGYVYTLTDSQGRCLTVANSSSIRFSTCDTHVNKRLALFKNSHVAGPIFQLVPRQMLGTYGISPRMCLRLASFSVGSGLMTAPCNPDDPLQGVQLGADDTSLPWLSFTTAWFIGQTPTADNLDIYVTWQAAGKQQNITYNNVRERGGLYVQDNTIRGVNYETIMWNSTIQPPDAMTTYHVCVKWSSPGSAVYNVILRVAVGRTPVFATSKTWNSQVAPGRGCTAADNGYMGSFTYPPVAGSS